MSKRDILVLKFGGTSMRDADAIARVMAIIQAESRNASVAAVVSAMAGVTDGLLDVGELCLQEKERRAEKLIQRLYLLHDATFLAMTSVAASREWIRRFLDDTFAEIRSVARGILLLGEFSDRTRDKLLSYGEILSSSLLARAMSEGDPRFCHADARDFLVADRVSRESVLDFDATEKLTQKRLLPLLKRGAVPVIPGFISRAKDGHATTLGRNGSDYSASIIGAALNAREIVIYTDVDGILTADPNLVAEASILSRISFQEAAEMSYFGAKVLHPKTMIPAVLKRIPIRIKNTFNSDAEGTLITDQAKRKTRQQVKTVTSVRNLALLNIQGNGMIGIPGVASRLFDVLARENVNIMMISQSSSEHSVCLVIHESEADRAVNAIRRDFRTEIDRNMIEDVGLVRSVAIVSIIGSGMRGTPGISGKFFEALGKGRINVLAIAQGASELNISAAIKEKDYRHAVQSIHSAFGLTRDLNVVLFGCGNIGRTLLKQIHENTRLIASKLEVNLKVLGVANTKNWLFRPSGLGASELQALASGTPLGELPESEPRPAAAGILEQVTGSFRSDVVVVDATAADLSMTHIEALQSGFHVVSANKRPLSTSLKDYREIQDLRRSKGLNYQYEATFGAGLPLLSTLQDLIHTGDRILSVQGCLSGTLGFICSQLDEGVLFSDALRAAMARGYTEPDPRDDLSGIDVARKSLIISREVGALIEMDDIRLRPMIPRRYFGAGSVAQFLDRLPSVNPLIEKESDRARKGGNVLRFLADITREGCQVGLQRVSRDSPIGRLAGPDNILVFRTQRYNETPLVIQGPGAGAGVTAAGVLSDLLKIAKWI